MNDNDNVNYSNNNFNNDTNNSINNVNDTNNSINNVNDTNNSINNVNNNNPKHFFKKNNNGLNKKHTKLNFSLGMKKINLSKKNKYLLLLTAIIILALALGLGLGLKSSPSSYAFNNPAYKYSFSEQIMNNQNKPATYYRYVLDEWKPNQFTVTSGKKYNLFINKAVKVNKITGGNSRPGFNTDINYNFSSKKNMISNPPVIDGGSDKDHPYSIFGIYTSPDAPPQSYVNVCFNTMNYFQIFVVGFGKNNHFSSYGIILSISEPPSPSISYSPTSANSWHVDDQITPVSGEIKRV